MAKKRTNPVDEPFFLSLTSKNSHKVEIAKGQGSFSIGAEPEKSFSHLDAIVDKDTSIDWDVFGEFVTPVGTPWPRFFYYLGNDFHFIEWSKNRPIENFYWHPYKDQNIDLKGAQINHFTIEILEDAKVSISNTDIDDLILEGALNNIEIKSNHLKSITLRPKLSKDSKMPAYCLPIFKSLSDIELIDINVPAVGQAFDCKSLIQFSHLKTVKLSGNFVNLGYLSNFLDLETLELRYCPNLEGLPPLETWSKLGYVLGWNIEEKNGKILRSQIKKLSKVRQMYRTDQLHNLNGPTEEVKFDSRVTNLRSREWFLEEYGLPFSDWPGKNEKVATKAYKKAAKIIAESKNKASIKEAIIEFTETFNKLEDIETTERDDLGIAIERLAEINPEHVDVKKALEWFDEVRDF